MAICPPDLADLFVDSATPIDGYSGYIPQSAMRLEGGATNINYISFWLNGRF